MGAKSFAGMGGLGLGVGPALVMGILTISSAAVESGDAGELVLNLV